MSMVNSGLTEGRAVARPAGFMVSGRPEPNRLAVVFVLRMPAIHFADMRQPRGPLEASSSNPKRSLIASALRTLEAEAGGIAALAAAMQDGLGQPFCAAIDLIRAARGRVIVTGMGKSGHVGRKIAATLRLDRHARLLRPSGRGEPRRPRHDHRATT